MRVEISRYFCAGTNPRRPDGFLQFFLLSYDDENGKDRKAEHREDNALNGYRQGTHRMER